MTSSSPSTPPIRPERDPLLPRDPAEEPTTEPTAEPAEEPTEDVGAADVAALEGTQP